jgi:hypothetical protein
MKKLILISIIGMMLSGCSNRSIEYSATIIKTEFYNKTMCKYYTTSSPYTGNVNTFNFEDPSFIDSCDKFHLGDTIKLTK